MTAGRVGRRRHGGRRQDGSRTVHPAARPGTYARARVRDLERALTTALNRAGALDYELPRRRVLELSRALTGDLRRIRELAGDFALDFDLGDGAARGLLRELARQRVFAVLDDGDRRARARDLARRLDRDIARFRGCAQEFAAARELAHAHAGGQLGGPGPVPAADPAAVELAAAPARVAAGLVAYAVHALPVESQARWREEFDGELRELAEGAVSWRVQVGHAVRVTSRVWSLRRAVRAPAPVRGGASG